MKEAMEEFEQTLENNTTREAIVKFYRTHARQIIVGIVSIGILIALAQSSLPVWQRYTAVLALVLANYAYGRYQENANN